MSATVNFVIRDGLASDIPDCLLLDHSYETDYVWQMQVNDEDGWRIDFKTERLPRALEVTYPRQRRTSARRPRAGAVFSGGDHPRRRARKSSAIWRCAAIRRTGSGWCRTSSSRARYRRHQIATRLTKIAGAVGERTSTSPA